MLRQKNIAISVLLTFITCGIYGIFWFVSLTNDAAYLNENRNFSGGKAFFFSIITCGIYTIYWNYKMGKELSAARDKKNLPANDNAIVYLILSIIGLGIVSYCIMQSEINEFVNAEA